MKLPALRWTPSPNFSARTGKVDLIVLHDCEGSYGSAVSWFANKASQVSAHVVLKEDGLDASQCVDFGSKAWHACDFNSRSVGIEMGGFAARGFPDAEWETAATVVAYLLKAYGLPAMWAHGGRGPGFTSHFDLGAAGGGHKDPTTDSTEWATFVSRVQEVYGQTSYDPRSPWGRGLPAANPASVVPAASVVSTTMTVAQVQAALNKANARPQLLVDGMNGQKTRDAVVKFQRAHNLFGDGIVNNKTAAALLAI